MSIHYMQEIQEMSPEELEKVLRHLPEPTYAEVALFGDFNYSDISRQAEEIVQGVRLQDKGGLVFKLKDASKEKVLELYRKSHELKIKELSAREETGIPRRIDIYKVGWYLDDNVQIELTPCEVNVGYGGKEPKYISQMRRELARTDVKLRIEVNK